ncbi:MAG: hypothetical protein EPO21_23580 [Chloroflexota bacterium]|nr:MAG: hypothetical protein EPO21_23580 [Chloroflexota bacterium]
MPRTVTVDNVQVQRIQLIKDISGNVQVYVDYNVRAGEQIVRPVLQDVTPRLSAARKAAVQAVFDGLVQDIAAIELA